MRFSLPERTSVLVVTMKKFIKSILPFLDILLAPAVAISALILKFVRRVGVRRMPLCKRVLLNVGVFPIRNHYYEPLFDGKLLRHPLDQPRCLPGVDWNIEEQLELLKSFAYAKEIGLDGDDGEFHFDLYNTAFGGADAEYLYNLIRVKKPARIIEIGSGNSTLVAMKAIQRNEQEVPAYKCRHICIEPYEMPWLERTGATIVRQPVERLDKKLFYELEENDLLFIDSSHVIRPQGDVLFEYLEVLPSLRRGVIVHAHDIMSPRDYPREWVLDDVRLWNEQYLLEAFLTGNRDWRIIGALNYLQHQHHGDLKSVCPSLTDSAEPGSFYIQKTA